MYVVNTTPRMAVILVEVNISEEQMQGPIIKPSMAVPLIHTINLPRLHGISFNSWYMFNIFRMNGNNE